MRIIRINTESPLYAETERIWLESFPENERRDVNMHKAAVDGDERFFYNAIVEDISADSCVWDCDCVASDAGIIDGDRVIGLLSWWALDGMVYVEHFAMSPSVRGRGLGEKIFTEVTGKFLLSTTLIRRTHWCSWMNQQGFWKKGVWQKMKWKKRERTVQKKWKGPGKWKKLRNFLRLMKL